MIIPKINLNGGSFFIGESCLNFKRPNRYNVNPAPTNIQIAINISLFSKPQCITRSAFERNLNAKASSIKPNTTFTVFSHPPDLGNELKRFGKSANKAKGNASANPNPAIPDVNCMAPPSADNEPASKDPKIGPVQENETSASVSAIKKIPTIFPAPALLSAPLLILPGKVIS